MANSTRELAALRDEIDRIDDAIASLVVERVQVATAIAEVKATIGQGIVDETREETVKAHYEDRFRRGELRANDGRAFAEQVIEIAIEHERTVEGEP